VSWLRFRPPQYRRLLAGALGPLRCALLEGLADGSPDLVRKLHSLSDRQFEELRRLTRGDG
jgi:hypothetical protein